MYSDKVFAPDSVVVSTFAGLLQETTGRAAGRLSATDRQRMHLEAEAARTHKEAYATGFREGQDEGRNLGREEGFAAAKAEGDEALRLKLEAFSEDLSHVEDLVIGGVHTWFKYAEAEVEALVSDIAREVIRQELKISRDSILGIVRRALQEVTLSRQAQIRVNPFDVETLNAAKEALMAAASSLRNLEIVDDPSILGGCIIETDGGIVDASVDAQIARLEAA